MTREDRPLSYRVKFFNFGDMKLDLEYLRERHEFWKMEIGNAGIWEPSLFGEVRIQVRPKCKSYNGLFSRRWLLKKGKRVLTDRIFIYENSEDFDPKFLDSVLVHEMIHQYIFQTKSKDTSSHGRLFRSYMSRINSTFPERLRINISDRNPSAQTSGRGDKTHRLMVSMTDKDFYCCVINPAKLKEFDRLIKRYKKDGVVKDYFWAQSNDVHFDRFVRCTKTLHGVKFPKENLPCFCRQYEVVRIPKTDIWERV